MASSAENNRTLQASQDATVIGVALAGIISVAVSEGPWDLYDVMVGCTLCLVLWGYGNFSREPVSSEREALAVASVSGFSVMLAVSPLLAWIASLIPVPEAAQNPGSDDLWSGLWFFVFWIATVLVIHGYLLHKRKRLGTS